MKQFNVMEQSIFGIKLFSVAAKRKLTHNQGRFVEFNNDGIKSCILPNCRWKFQ